MSTSPDRIYYDIQVQNYQSTTTESPMLTFSESRTIPIVTRADDYYLSIVRFQLDTYSLPTFIADIQPAQSDPNKMIHSVTLEWQTGSTVNSTNAQFLNWIPSNANIEVPLGPSNNPGNLQSNATQYYYGNSFRHFCDIVNNAFITVTNTLKTQVGSALTNLLPPFLVWNEITSCAELHAQDLFYNWSRTNHVNIYFNRALFAKFNSMPGTRYGIQATLGRFYKMYMKDDNSTRNLQIVTSTGSQLFIKTPQEYSTISNWSPVAAIVFTSSLLPVVANQMSAPVVYDNNNVIVTGLTPNFSNVISDLATNEMCYKPNLLYVPTAEYRRIDLLNSQPISSIDIQVFWKDHKGNLNPFILLSGASASIKLLFEKKRKL
jgi:hypothetical protein